MQHLVPSPSAAFIRRYLPVHRPSPMRKSQQIQRRGKRGSACRRIRSGSLIAKNFGTSMRASIWLPNEGSMESRFSIASRPTKAIQLFKRSNSERSSMDWTCAAFRLIRAGFRPIRKFAGKIPSTRFTASNCHTHSEFPRCESTRGDGEPAGTSMS